jgi:sugar lactone lactonase YvrE
MTETYSPTALTGGLAFPEGPRWHEGQLFFTDIHGGRVRRAGLDGGCEVIAEVRGASGLGFMPDGRINLSSLAGGDLLRLAPDGTVQERVDLSSVAGWPCNDVITDAQGRTYLGQLNNPQMDQLGIGAATIPPADTPAPMVLVDPDGTVRAATTETLAIANGIAISPDARTMVIAETGTNRLRRWDVASDGTLSNPQRFGEVDVPDGICLDAEGAAWIACPIGMKVVRMLPGGEIVDSVDFDNAFPTACVLGGPERRTLFMTVARELPGTVSASSTSGTVEYVEVAVQGAGAP